MRYEKPEISIFEIECADVIMTSGELKTKVGKPGDIKTAKNLGNFDGRNIFDE